MKKQSFHKDKRLIIAGTILLLGLYLMYQQGVLPLMIGSQTVPANPDVIGTGCQYFGTDSVTYNYTKFVQPVTVTTGETVDTLYAYLRQSFSSGNGAAMPVVYSATGALLAKGSWKTVVFTTTGNAGFHWEAFPLSQPVTINPGTVMVGLATRGASLRIAVNSPFHYTGWYNKEANPNDARCPSDPFDASGMLGTYVASGHQDMVDNFALYLIGTSPYPPTARFTVSSSIVQVGTQINFDASSSTAAWDGSQTVPISSYNWAFGDGQTRSLSTPTTSYAYSVAGQYTVSLTVTAGLQTSAPSTLVVTIQAIQPLEVSISPSAANVFTSGQVTLTATITGGQSGATTLEWYEGITTPMLKQSGAQTTYVFFGSIYSIGNYVTIYCKAIRGSETATSNQAIMSIIAAPVQQWGLTITSTYGGTTDKTGSISTNVGTSLIVTAQPITGYKLDHWESSIGSINLLVDNPITVPSQAASSTSTLTAIFTLIPERWIVSVTSTYGGMTDKTGTVNATVGTSIMVTAVPTASNYVFDHWESDITSIHLSTSNPLTIPSQAVGTYTLLAVFVEAPPPVVPPEYIVMVAIGGIVVVAAVVLLSKRKKK